MNSYEEEDEEQNKIKIPKYKILYLDLEITKREEFLSMAEKTIEKTNSVKKEDIKKTIEKVMECI
jgi:hypothetical protein